MLYSLSRSSTIAQRARVVGHFSAVQIVVKSDVFSAQERLPLVAPYTNGAVWHSTSYFVRSQLSLESLESALDISASEVPTPSPARTAWHSWLLVVAYVCDPATAQLWYGVSLFEYSIFARLVSLLHRRRAQ
jgi:hypothetical protein